MHVNRPLLVLASLSALVQTHTALAAACQLRQIASIPATLSPRNQLLIDATINDAPVKIQIDTGAAVSVLSRKFAARIGMPIQDVPGMTYGLTGRALNEMAKVRSLRIGNKASMNEDMVLSGYGGDGTDDVPVALFGADYLQNYDVEIDVAGGKVNLFDQDHCPGQVVYWSADFFKTPLYYAGNSTLHRPSIDITIDGKPVRALIDTGAGATAMRMMVAQDKFDLSPDSADMVKAGQTKGVDDTPIDVYWHTFQSMTFGDITLHNTRMMIAPSNVASHIISTGTRLNPLAASEPDVLIGMTLLKQLRLFISYGERTLYYTIAAPKPAKP